MTSPSCPTPSDGVALSSDEVTLPFILPGGAARIYQQPSGQHAPTAHKRESQPGIAQRSIGIGRAAQWQGRAAPYTCGAFETPLHGRRAGAAG